MVIVVVIEVVYAHFMTHAYALCDIWIFTLLVGYSLTKDHDLVDVRVHIAFEAYEL